MAPSQKDSHSRPWPRGQHHYVDFDDRVKCCMAWSWNSNWVTIADCEHSCVGSNESDSCARIDIIATRDCGSLHCPLKCDGSFDCDSSTLDNYTDLVCLYVVARSPNTSIMEVKAQQHSRISCINGNGRTQCCLFACVGSVFHLVEESCTYRHHNNGTCTDALCCIFRVN